MKKNPVETCTIWEMNPNSSGLQAWWRSYLQSIANGYDLYFIDNDSMTVKQSSYFSQSGGGCPPWPTVCTTTEEIPDDAHEVIARANFVSAMTHKNGSPMLFLFQQVSWNPLRDASAFVVSGKRFVGITCEGCIAATSLPTRPNLYGSVLNEMASVHNVGGAFLLISQGNFPKGSPTQIAQRLVTTAITWLGYVEGLSAVQPNLEYNTPNLAVWPEDFIYPSSPVQSMVKGSTDLQVAPGIFRREFSNCFLWGKPFGHCAVILSANPSPVMVSRSWLTQTYAHSVTLAGGDVLARGSVNIIGATFVVGASRVQPGGALLLTP
jgi:hypothetical protein